MESFGSDSRVAYYVASTTPWAAFAMRSATAFGCDTIDEAWLSQAPLRAEVAGALPSALQDQEKELIEAALAKSRGKVTGPSGAAIKLGIPASTLESKIKQLGIEKGRFTNLPDA